MIPSQVQGHGNQVDLHDFSIRCGDIEAGFFARVRCLLFDQFSNLRHMVWST